MTPVLSRQRVERIAARAVVAPAPPERRLVPSVLTLRLATCCAFLFLLAFSQDPGKVSRDTKLDLVVDPVGFLTRALSLWDDSSAFGQLQFDYKNYLYLTATGRNDWTSTIPPGSNSFFYPSLSASFVFSASVIASGSPSTKSTRHVVHRHRPPHACS